MLKATIPEFTDSSPFPFGKYGGVPFKDVPVDYLHWVWHNTKPTRADMQGVHNYIHKNINALKKENSDLLWSK